MLAAHVNEAESETQGKDRMQAVIPEAQGREWGGGRQEGGGRWWAGNYQHGYLGPILQGSSKKAGRMKVSIISLGGGLKCLPIS